MSEDKKQVFSDEELKKVAGGKSGDICTTFKCTNCPNEEYWLGNYMGTKHNCSRCNLENGMVAINTYTLS